MVSLSTEDMKKYFDLYTERFNYYLNWTMGRFERGLRTDQYVALGCIALGFILIILSILLW